MQIGEPIRSISIAPLEVPGEPSALTAPPRLRVTLFLSRQPEESCGTLGRDRIRCGLDGSSYADVAASLFS
jgi:hypothetical protein